MRSLRTIIIEDDVTIRALLRYFAERTPGLELVGDYSDPIEAGGAFTRMPIDLVLLDIRLPVLSGFSFLDSLEQRPMVVVVSADAGHAARAFDYAAIDFLHKPFTHERFLKAMDRVMQSPEARRLGRGRGATAVVPELDRVVHLRCEGAQVEVRLGDIELVQSMGNYVKLHLRGDGKLVAGVTMARMEELLPPAHFVRIHRSYIITFDAVHAVRARSVEWRKGNLPLGDTYKQQALQALTGRR